VDGIYFGTTSSPYIEFSTACIVGEALSLERTAEVIDFNSTPCSGTTALKACFDAVKAGRLKSGLVIGADNRSSQPGSDLEIIFGAASASLLLGRENVIAEIEQIYTYSSYIIDRWQGRSDSFVRSYDYRFTRQYGFIDHVTRAVRGLAERTGDDLNNFDHLVIQGVDSRMLREVVHSLKLSEDRVVNSSFINKLGDTGSSSVLLGICAAIEKAKPGERILAISYGSGISDAITIRVLPAILQSRHNRTVSDIMESKEYINYYRYLKNREVLSMPGVEANMGVPPMSPLLWRDKDMLLKLWGKKCTKCGFMNFPPSQRLICIRCGSTEMHVSPISRKGKIVTFTVNYKLPAPLESPLPVIIADLDDGTRYRALGTEMTPEDIKVGSEVELVFRKLATERGVNLYGYKFKLLDK
jgi:hydroxymethylglutaryl-CoA synthase